MGIRGVNRDGELIESLTRNIACGVMAADRVGRVFFMNLRASALIGRSRRDVMGQRVQEILNLCDHDTRAPVRLPGVASFRRSSRPFILPHAVLTSSNGQETPVETAVTPLRLRDRTIAGSVLLIQDISHRLDRQLRLLDKHKMDAMAMLAGSIGLDFNAWLTTISSHASSLADTLQPESPPYEDARKILDALASARDLSKRLLSVARAGDVKGEVSVQPVALGETIRTAISMVEGTLRKQRIALRIRHLDTMPFVLAETAQLLDCLIHLVVNAVDAMPNGGTITIDAAEKRIGRRMFAVLRLRDTGHGMPKRILDHIFEPFFSTKNEGSAVGLGLTVVRNAVQRWGGNVTVRSRPGWGTAFRLFLRKARTLKRASAPQFRKRGLTILVVDDRKDLLVETRKMLRQAGYKVLTASRAEHAIDLYKKHAGRVRVCLVDLVMTGKDGKYAMREILKINPNAAGILMSGFSRDYVRGYVEQGSWLFLQKPFTREQVLRSLRRVLEREAARSSEAGNRPTP